MEQQVHLFKHHNEKMFGTLRRPETHSDIGILMGRCFTRSRHTRVLQQISRNQTKAKFMVLRFNFSGASNDAHRGQIAELLADCFTRQRFNQ